MHLDKIQDGGRDLHSLSVFFLLLILANVRVY